MNKAVAIGEAKTNLSKLVERAERGEEVVIRRGANPVVKIVRYTESDQTSPFGSLKGKIRIGEDFDEPIPGFEPFQ